MKNVTKFLLLSSVLSLVLSSCNMNTEEKKAEYTVSHYVQNIEDDEYTLLETEKFTGISGETAEVSVKTMQGFTVVSAEDTVIRSGKNIVVKYDRNIITCTFNFNGGKIVSEDNSEITFDVVSGKFGAVIPKPTPVKNGYVLEDWIDTNGNSLGETFEYSRTYTASYVTKSTACYKVHHLYQNIENDEYTENLSEQQILEGLTGTKTNAAAKEVEGFTAKAVVQTTVLSDESAEVNVYYDRNLVSFSFNLTGGSGNSIVTKKYGTTVSSAIVNDPVKSNATFSGWNPSLPDTFTDDMTFTAVWNVPFYTVNYLFENVEDSDYSADVNFPSEKYYGLKNSLTSVTAKQIPGFIPEEITQATIKEDNSTVVTVKYKRKIITLYINLRGGSGDSYIKGKYGESNESVAAKLNSLANPIKPGFSLEAGSVYNYDSSLDFSLANDETTQITVNWVGGKSNYYVVVLKENAEFTSAEDRYTQTDFVKLEGQAGEMTNLTVNNADNSALIGGRIFSYENFIPAENKNIEIAGDDSTVLYVYFNRKIVNITYNLNGGNIDGSTDDVIISGRYGSAVSGIPQNAIREGCTSFAWDKTYATFPSEDCVVTAKWTGKPYNVTFHLGEQTETKAYNYIQEYAVPDLTVLTTLTLEDGGVSGWKLSEAAEEADYCCGKTFTLPLPQSLDLYACVDTNYYTVQCFLQNLSDDNYTQDTSRTEKVYSKTGITTQVVAKEITGFNSLDFEQKTVAEDDSTVIKLYYNRNIYTVSFDLDGGFAYVDEDKNNVFDKDSNGNYIKLSSIPSVQCKYGSSYKNEIYGIHKNGYNYENMKWILADGTVKSTYNGSHAGFDVSNITSDMNLKLSGEKVTYTVKLYNLNSDSSQSSYTINVDTNNRIADIVPKISGYDFVGWYTDSLLTKALTGSTLEKCVITEPYNGSSKKVIIFAKWRSINSLPQTKYVQNVGDIILSDGNVINIPFIEGLEVSLTSDQKDQAVGVVSHNMGTDSSPDWRFLGKYEQGKQLKWGELKNEDSYGSCTEETDGSTVIGYMNSGTDLWNFISSYGSTHGSAWPTKYKSNWYLPANGELSKIAKNVYTINYRLKCIDGGFVNSSGNLATVEPGYSYTCNSTNYIKSGNKYSSSTVYGWNVIEDKEYNWAANQTYSTLVLHKF